MDISAGNAPIIGDRGPVSDGIKSTGKFSGSVWEGIFANFDEVPASGDGFAGERWTRAIVKAQEPSTGVGCILSKVLGDSVWRAPPVRILDFGGGAGGGYKQARKDLPTLELEYHVVEMANICEAGRKLFADDPMIHFHSSIPESIKSIDVAHFGSSIQYVRNWQKTLTDVARLGPRHIVFSDLAAGENPTYVSTQTYYESRIPVWFFNFNDFAEFLASLGYALAFRVKAATQYFGVEQPCPQDNFPPEFRMGFPTHVLFTKA